AAADLGLGLHLALLLLCADGVGADGGELAAELLDELRLGDHAEPSRLGSGGLDAGGGAERAGADVERKPDELELVARARLERGEVEVGADARLARALRAFERELHRVADRAKRAARAGTALGAEALHRRPHGGEADVVARL